MSGHNSALAELKERLAHELEGAPVTVAMGRYGEVEVRSVARGENFLAVQVQGPADFQVAYHVPSRRGSPFEQIIAGTPEESHSVLVEVLKFVTDIV